jgi:hypothetical protein
MAALYEEGAIRVQPASEYAKPDHNGAVRDDERALEVSLYLTRETIRKVVINPLDVPDDLEGKRLDFRFSRTKDFWLYCVSSSVEPRLFVDFKSKACVIIRDRDEFRRRLEAASLTAFPGARYRHGDAVYIDPMLPRSARIEGIAYEDLRRVLVPSRNRHDRALVFNYTKFNTSMYGQDVVHRLLPLLRPNSSHSFLFGDWIHSKRAR